MKITRLKNHNLQNTLFQIERMSKQYFNDLQSMKDLNIYQIFDYLSKTIKFEKDPDGNEFIQRPCYLMKTGKGDCDCKTTFFLAWLRLKGYPAGYSIVTDTDNKPYHHIFPFMYEGNKIIDLDATYPHNKIGESKRWKKRQNFYIKE
jgi:hypothetical protein